MTNPPEHEIQQEVGESVVGEVRADDSHAPVNLGVTVPAIVAILAIIVWGLVWPDSFSTFASSSLNWVVENIGWLFILASTVFVFFIVPTSAWARTPRNQSFPRLAGLR